MPSRCPQCGCPFPPRTPLPFLEADAEDVTPATDTPAVRCNQCGAWWNAALIGGLFFDALMVDAGDDEDT